MDKIQERSWLPRAVQNYSLTFLPPAHQISAHVTFLGCFQFSLWVCQKLAQPKQLKDHLCQDPTGVDYRAFLCLKILSLGLRYRAGPWYGLAS